MKWGAILNDSATKRERFAAVLFSPVNSKHSKWEGRIKFDRSQIVGMVIQLRRTKSMIARQSRSNRLWNTTRSWQENASCWLCIQSVGIWDEENAAAFITMVTSVVPLELETKEWTLLQDQRNFQKQINKGTTTLNQLWNGLMKVSGLIGAMWHVRLKNYGSSRLKSKTSESSMTSFFVSKH